MLSIIVAKSKNNVIGKDNSLLWHISDDLKRFKELTTGHTIIMGRKTFESIGKALPNRKNIVLTRNFDFNIEDQNVEIVYDVSELQKFKDSEEECFIIGGALIYNLTINMVDKLYVTEIDKDFEGDAFFPKIDEEKWRVVESVDGPQDDENDFTYRYVTYERK